MILGERKIVKQMEHVISHGSIFPLITYKEIFLQQPLCRI
jgi:hypothetical protein